jgi:glycosyltransferase involved in cell wall biosynthesis
VHSFFPGETPARGINENKILGIYFRALPLLFDEWRLSGKIAAWVPNDLDILNPHDNHVFQAAAEWKRRTGKSVLWMMNDFPTVILPATRFSGPLLNTVYDILNGKRLIRRWYEDSMRAMDRIAVLDDMISRKYLEDQFQIRPVTIRSGLDLSKFVQVPREPYRGGRTLRVFSNGIMFPHRRLEIIVEAVRFLKDAGLDLVWSHVGSEELHREYAKEVRRCVKSAGIAENSEIIGKISDAEMVKMYQSADIFVFPNFPQTWGLAVFEAMACGTPVVVSKGAGASEVLTDRVNSLLVDPGNPAQIASAIRRIAENPLDWKELSREGRRFVEENITWEKYARKMREEMEAVCSSREI